MTIPASACTIVRAGARESHDGEHDDYHNDDDYHPRLAGWGVGLSATHTTETGETAGACHAVFVCKR
ncbi:MAG: hypothetical protein M3Z19_14220, partial [Chloroflexota bacterium]|nr:hypothetical protein [Chloroflexota bacterium]